MHELDIIPTLVGGLGAALLFGYATHRLGMSPIVGYLLAGVVIGPNSPGFTADTAIANQFAEVGVVLLMFGVGLHFDLDELMRVRRIALPGSVWQCALTVLMGISLALLFGWTVIAALIFGISIAFASTVVVTRLLADVNELQTQTGNVAIGWLIVQDLLAVLVLVLLPALANGGSLSPQGIAQIILLAAIKMGLVILGITFVGGRVIPWLLRYVAETRSRELFTLTVLVIVLGIALASAKLFGVSMALGAFLAGVVVGQSDFSLRAASEALPMRDAFAVLFFVSIGMLFDPIVFFQSSQLLFGTLLVILIGTPLVSFMAILAGGYPLRLALRVALSLAQIGEFTFVVGNLALHQQLIPSEAMHVLVAASILTISIAPLLQLVVDPITRVCNRSRLLHPLITMRRPFSLTPAAASTNAAVEVDDGFRTVIVGYGPVGKTVARLLQENGVTPTIIEMNHANLATIRGDGYRAVLGDANHIETLKHAGIASSLSLILSASTIRGAAEIIRLARELNPKIKVIVRSAYLRERLPLIQHGADTVFAGEGEVAMALAEYILRDLGATPEQIDRERDRLRSDLLK